MEKNNMNTQSKPNYMIPLIFVGMFFLLLGFSLGINGLLIPYLKKALSLSNADSYLVLTASFSAFVVLGYPSGLVIKRVGYKKSIIISFAVFALGLYLFIPSAKQESLILFLVSSFVCGSANTLLQTAINPYITILGPIDSAAKRLNIMVICNRAGWALAPIFLALFLDLSQTNIKLSDMYLPFYMIVGVFVLLGFATFFAPLPEIKAEGEDDENESDKTDNQGIITASKKNIWQFPHLLLGVVTLFFFVGVDTITLVSPVDFAYTLGMDHPEQYTMHTVIATSLGCILGIIFIPRYISQLLALQIGALSGLVIAILIVLLPPGIAIHLVSLIGFSISIVWGAVWPLAISHLGRFTKTGASFLVMAIVGGAILPLCFGWFKDALGDIQQAYWIFVPALLFIVFYALKGYQIGLKTNISSV
jgi:MFS transporter, FHS family, L-fucose permease